LDRHLIVFIKNPEEGKVKTRIAHTIGNAGALNIYLTLIDIVHHVVINTDTVRHVFYSEFLNKNDRWSDTSFCKHVQTGHDLGERMKNAFKSVFNAYSEQDTCKVVIIGSDCPYLTPSIMDDAFFCLEQADFVVGPTYDGGYYLLGMKIFTPNIFDDIEWSTESVFDQTIDKIKNQGSTFQLLPTLHDIDTEDDWNRYKTDH
jgi:rSAM/selenodomain-associated transferase 1